MGVCLMWLRPYKIYAKRRISIVDRRLGLVRKSKRSHLKKRRVASMRFVAVYVDPYLLNCTLTTLFWVLV
jgi:hypothetical protein